MSRGRHRLGVLCAALALSLCCVTFFTATEAHASQVVRVAYPLQAGLCEVDENGNYSGYTYEYLEEIAQYTGWDFEFVQAGSADESFSVLMEQLQKGEIDMMGDLVYSEAMAETVDYASQSYGTAYTTLEVLNENTAITMDSYQTMQGMTIAVPSTSKVRVAELEQFCKTNGIRYTLLRLDSMKEMLASLESGAADAILSTDLTPSPDTRTIAKFSPRPFYFVTTKGNAGILQKLNKALLNISEVDPAFSGNLRERYFGDSGGGVVFSNEDLKYIAGAETLRVGVLESGAPFQWWEEKTGTAGGIAADVLSYVAQATGLRFTFVPAVDQNELQRMVDEGEVDLVGSLAYDYRQAGERHLSLTRPYASSQNMMLGSEGKAENGLRGKRIAVPRSLYGDVDTSEYTSPYNMVEEVVWFDTLDQCVEALRTGEADYTCGDNYSIQYFINRPENRKLHVLPLPQSIYRVSLGVARTGNEALLTVLNKAIINLPAERLQSIVYGNITYQGKMTVWEYVEANPAQAILTLGGAALAVILSLLALLLTRVRVSRQAALDLKKHYQLYALSNDHFFEYDFRKDRLMLSIREGQGEEQESSVFVYENAEKVDRKDDLRTEFVRYVKGREDGSEELQCAFFSKELRWLRVTTRRIYDGGVPAYVVGKFTDVDEEHREKDELLDQAQKDGLTQVYHAAETRSRIVERLEVMPAGCRDAMVIVDIDYFKGINDEFGHFVGDQILQQVADAMRAVCDKDDFVGRLGGDEFVLYLNGVTPTSTMARCQYLRSEILQIRLPQEARNVTVSIGAALSTVGMDYDVLYQRADGALYDAKNQGRDRIAVAAEEQK